ncbi:SAV_2336 N-terminal domain-related protein [Streptomyces sp. CWNU-52B]|uniref:SAV_2336 N-terminal domain-related protein n=1 Tax=unclassified Streptomyces TaxID=2593676 RepID=UPI0039C2644A
MADALESLIRALAGALSEDADATAIADALWLAAAPGAPADPTARGAQGGGPPEPVPPSDAGTTGQRPAPDPFPEQPTGAASAADPGTDPGETVLYESLPHTRSAPGASVTVPGGRDLPRALELRRALRPFKRRHPRGRRSELDLDATVRDYRRTGELTPVLSPAPEPWFDVLLVIDASPSMAVWDNTNAEFAALLAGLGAFRSVRTWRLSPGADPVLTDHQGRRVAPGQAVSADGRRLVLVLSDCVAPGWRRAETWQLLRRWGARSPVALLNPLPGRLWHRTGLNHPAIRVAQRRPGVRNADLTFHVPLLLRTLPGAATADWQPLPTLTFSPHSLARWAETFMRGSPQGYDAVLVPSGGVVPSLFPTPNGGRRATTTTTTGPDRTEAFLRTASPSAVRLAALCSPFGSLSLPLLHLIRQQVLPEAGVDDLAELLTNPVVTITEHEDRPPVVRFDDTTRERLASRLGRRDAWRTYEALSRHLAARAPGGAEDVLATATADPESVPADLYPFARASGELLTLLREGAPTPPAPTPARRTPTPPAPPRDPGPAQGLPDPARSTALLIGVSRYTSEHDLPGVEADLMGMRAYLTSPEGWNLPADRCVSLVNPSGAREVLEAVARACDTDDTVLIYFAGHGVVDGTGKAHWLLAGEHGDVLSPKGSLEFSRVAHAVVESWPRHVMLILDHDGGASAAHALEERAGLRGRGRRMAPRVQTLFAERGRNDLSGGSLTQELLRVASQGLPGGPEFLDLRTVVRAMSGFDLWSNRRVLGSEGDAPPCAFARNRAWVSPASAPEPVDPVYASIQAQLRAALPRTYRGRYRSEADRLLRELLAFMTSFIDGAGQADSELTLAGAVQEFLGDRGITTEREVLRGDLGWFSEAGLFTIRVAGDGATVSWNAEPSVSFELVLDREGHAWMTDLVECLVSDTSDSSDDLTGGGERSCLVIIRLPVPRDSVHHSEDTADEAESEATDAPWGLRWFRRDALSDAVESACEQLLGEAVGGETADDFPVDETWTLNGVALPPGLIEVTIQDVTPDTQSIVWDVVEEYEEGLVLGQVTVDVQLVLEGLMHKSDYSLTEEDIRLVGDVNDHMVEVSVERSAQLVFDARRESEEVELEFRGTNPPEPHPHEDM